MKNIAQLQNELFKNEQLTQTDLMSILGGKRKNKSKHIKRNDDADDIESSISYREVSADSYSFDAVEDDKRRARPGGGTTTTSPNSFV